MARSIRHLTICIRGVLSWESDDLNKLFTYGDGTYPTLDEVHKYLNDKLEEGYEVIPLNGVECEGFDKKEGCPGHEVNEEKNV